MAGIYNADIFCDDCIRDIKDNITFEIWDGVIAAMPDGSSPNGYETYYELWDYLDGMDERDYDSDEYPKWCSDDAESDSPQHCGAGSDCINSIELPDGHKVGYCLGNDLTSDGVKYLVEAIRDGDSDSVANRVWNDLYSCYL